MNRKRFLVAMLMVCLILGSLVLPMSASAAGGADAGSSATTNQQPGPMPNGGPPNMPQGLMPVRVDESALTDAQKQAYATALDAYIQAQQDALQGLVQSGIITQAEVDDYVARFQQQGSQPPPDGQRGQDPGQNSPPQGGGDMFMKLMNQQDDSAVQAALTALESAQQAFTKALGDNNIEVLTMGNGGPGMQGGRGGA